MNKNVMRVCKLTCLLLSFSTNLLAPLIPTLRDYFDLSISQGGFLISSFFAGNFIASILCGKLAACFSARKVLNFGLCMITAFLILSGLMPSFILLCITLFFMGYGSLTAQVMANSIPTTYDSPDAASSVTGTQAYCGLGACFGLLFSGGINLLGLSWRYVYLISGGFGVAITVFCLLTKLPKPANAVCTGSIRELLRVATKRAFLPILFCAFLYSGAESSICNWLVTYLVEHYNFTAFAGSAVTAGIWFFSFVGRVACSKLVRKIPRHRVVLVLAVCTVLSSFVLPSLGGGLIWVGAALLGLSTSGVWSIICSPMMEDPTCDSATTLACAFFYSFAGQTIVPYGVGVGADTFGMATAIRLCSGLFFGLLLIYIGMFLTKKRKKVSL